MKLPTFLLAACLSLAAFHSHEVQAETMVDIMNIAIQDTMPCLIPCIMDNIEPITKTYITKCIPGANKLMAKIFPNLIPGLNPGRNPGAGQPPDMMSIINDVTSVIREGKHCDLYKFTRTCYTDILKTHCNNPGLTKQFDELEMKTAAYLNCPKGAPQGDIVRCFANPGIERVILGCVADVNRTHHGLFSRIATQAYDLTYDTILTSPDGPNSKTPPEICKVGEQFKTCLLDNLQRELGRENCPDTALDNLRDEINAFFEFINCRRDDPHPENNILRCLADPKLIIGSVIPCFQANQQNLSALNIAVVKSDGTIGPIQYDKMCDVVPILDECIEKKMHNVTSCSDENQWTLKTYTRLFTPSRNHILTQCNQPDKIRHDQCLLTGGAETVTSSLVQFLTASLTLTLTYLLH